MPGGPMSEIEIRPGFAEEHRHLAAELYWQAFSQKLAPVMNPADKALQFLVAGLRPDHAFSAVDLDGELLGLAGFKTMEGAFVDGGLRELAGIYGWPGAIWRGVLLNLMERALEPDILLMDGIFVNEAARGKGVGSALLKAIYDEAERRDLSSVRLDVIDTNPRARALYERQGFVATETVRLGPLRHVFGFRSATTMVRPVR